MSTTKPIEDTRATERQEQLKDVHAGGTGHVVTSEASHATAARLASGYSANEQRARDERVTARKNERDELAARFKENPQLEAVLALRESSPRDFDSMNVGAMRMSIAMYEKDRHAFKKTGEFSKEALDALRQKVDLEQQLAELEAIAQGGAPDST